MSEDKICTSFELKRFAFNEHKLSAFNFAKWIESKSRDKFTVIEKEFISDTFLALENHAKATNNINAKMKKKWAKLIP